MNKQVELIKAEIERLKGQLIRGACSAQVSMESNCKDEAYNEVLAFINSFTEDGSSNTHTEELKNEIVVDESLVWAAMIAIGANSCKIGKNKYCFEAYPDINGTNCMLIGEGSTPYAAAVKLYKKLKGE